MKDSNNKIKYPKTDWQREIYQNPKYLGKIIAITNNKFSCYSDTYRQVIKEMDKQKKPYSLFKVPENLWSFRLLTFKIKSLI